MKNQSQNTSADLQNQIYYKRFKMLMKLIRIDKMLRSAKIIHADKNQK